jgi:hypothetical protein
MCVDLFNCVIREQSQIFPAKDRSSGLKYWTHLDSLVTLPRTIRTSEPRLVVSAAHPTYPGRCRRHRQEVASARVCLAKARRGRWAVRLSRFEPNKLVTEAQWPRGPVILKAAGPSLVWGGGGLIPSGQNPAQPVNDLSHPASIASRQQ